MLKNDIDIEMTSFNNKISLNSDIKDMKKFPIFIYHYS